MTPWQSTEAGPKVVIVTILIIRKLATSRKGMARGMGMVSGMVMVSGMSMETQGGTKEAERTANDPPRPRITR